MIAHMLNQTEDRVRSVWCFTIPLNAPCVYLLNARVACTCIRSRACDALAHAKRVFRLATVLALRASLLRVAAVRGQLERSRRSRWQRLFAPTRGHRLHGVPFVRGHAMRRRAATVLAATAEHLVTQVDAARNNFTESTNFRAPVQHNYTHNRCKPMRRHLANGLRMTVCEGLLPTVRTAGSECAHVRTVSTALNCTLRARHPEELCGTWRFSSRFWRPRNGARTVRCASRSSRQVRFSQTFGESHTQPGTVGHGDIL